MALGILREISCNIQEAKIYTIMTDETADVSNTEQLVICFRWVDDNLSIHEDFIGLHPMARTDADSIVQVLKVQHISKSFQQSNLRLYFEQISRHQ